MSLPDRSADPAAVVRSQVEAYNDCDVDAFAGHFHEDAVAETIDGDVIAEGEADLRAEWGPLFEAFPDLDCEVTDRLTLGEFVVDRERVTGLDDPFDAIAIYRVEDGRIDHVWFVQ